MTLRLFQFSLLAFVALFTGVYALLMPSLTRRGLLFGVTVAPDARETRAGRRIVAGYRAGVATATAIFLAALGAGYALAPDAWLASPWLALAYLAVVPLHGIPYLAAHAASRRLAAVSPAAGATAAQPTAALAPRHYGDYVPWIWELLPVALIAATAAYLASRYDAAPAVIAVHFDASGHANRFAPKTVGSFFTLVWTQLFLELLLTAMGALLVGGKTVPGRASERFRRAYLRLLFGLKALIIALMGGLAAVAAGATGASTVPVGVPLATGGVILVAAFAGVLALALRAGQGGARLGPTAETATDRLDDRRWIWGVIYYNPDDPAIFVERRFGIGWTINAANPRALGVLLGILALAAAFALLMAVVTR